MIDRLNHLMKTAEAIYRDKGSKFIAHTYAIQDEKEVAPILETLRKSHPTARHWCYAWRLGEQGEFHRSNDDGEPSSSAGRPILTAIDQLRLTNVLVVVVRYFGGTLLGVRGLIDAYGGSARLALADCSLEPLPLLRHLRISAGYERMAEIQHVMNELGLKPIQSDYENETVGFVFQEDKELIEKALNRFQSIYGIDLLDS